MNGVTVLNTYTQLANGQTIFGFLVGLIFLFFVAILLFITYSFNSFEEKKKNKHAYLVVAVISFVLFIVGICNFPSKEYQTYYQVTINDSVSLNEFQKKYEIIKVDGKIYTVKEAEENGN